MHSTGLPIPPAPLVNNATTTTNNNHNNANHVSSKIAPVMVASATSAAGYPPSHRPPSGVLSYQEDGGRRDLKAGRDWKLIVDPTIHKGGQQKIFRIQGVVEGVSCDITTVWCNVQV